MSSNNDDDVWAQLKEKLPYERTEEEKQKRMDQWNKIDVNGNGYLSLAEVDKGMRDVVGLPILFENKPVLMRAFQAAKSVAPSASDKDDNYIQKKEYRLLLQYLRQYYEFWLAFERLDTDDDRRIGFEEFVEGKDMLTKWNIDMSDPEAQWQKCDKNSGGKILFSEFCDWAIQKNLDLDYDDN